MKLVVTFELGMQNQKYQNTKSYYLKRKVLFLKRTWFVWPDINKSTTTISSGMTRASCRLRAVELYFLHL